MGHQHRGNKYAQTCSQEMNIQEWVHYYKAYIFYSNGEAEDRSQLIELEVVVGIEFLRE